MLSDVTLTAYVCVTFIHRSNQWERLTSAAPGDSVISMPPPLRPPPPVPSLCWTISGGVAATPFLDFFYSSRRSLNFLSSSRGSTRLFSTASVSTLSRRLKAWFRGRDKKCLQNVCGSKAFCIHSGVVLQKLVGLVSCTPYLNNVARECIV